VIAGLLLGAVAVVEYLAGESAARVMWLVTAFSIVPATLVAGAVLHRAARQWPDVPATVRRLTPHPRPRTTVRQFWREVPTFHRRWFAVFASTACVLLVLNAAAPTALRAIDEPLYDAIGSPAPDPWGPDWFGMYFGRPQVVIPVALLVALFTVRCRVLAIAYPVTIVFGGLLNLGLGALVGKDRPPLGAHAHQTDSFPSGHAIEVTLLLGLLPLAVAVLLRSRWVGAAMRVVASGVLAVMLVDGLREGSHWPSDHVGGFAIAMTAVVVVHALARMPSLHRSCTRCPTASLRPHTVRRSRGDP
jgi:membrane-associated phospholipid phosphatase